VALVEGSVRHVSETASVHCDSSVESRRDHCAVTVDAGGEAVLV
jgi:hypothetical protein